MARGSRFLKFVGRYGNVFLECNHAGGPAGLEAAMDAARPPPELDGDLSAFLIMELGEADYLYTAASRARVGIVEIGRRHGGSTLLMAHANPGLPLLSIDKEPVDDDFLRKLLADADLPGVELVVMNSQEPLPESRNFGYDLLFIDGDHSYEGCLGDLANWYPGLRPGGHVILHDCRGREPVVDAVEYFLDNTPDAYAIRGPYIPSGGCREWGGSLAHLRKRPRLVGDDRRF